MKWVIIIVMLAIGAGAVSVALDNTKPKGKVPLPEGMADNSQLQSIQEYFAEDPNRCPKIRVSDAARQKFPQLPQILATLSYLLDRGELGGNKPGFRTLNRKEIAAIRGYLNDPSIEIGFDQGPLSDQELGEKVKKRESVAGAVTSDDGTRITLTPASGSFDSKTYLPWKHPLRLGTTILHELYHVYQVRQGKFKVEDPAYAAEWVFSATDKRLFQRGISFSTACYGMPFAEEIAIGASDIDTSFVIVLDGSGSMRSNDRMAKTKLALQQFLETGFPQGSEVGLVIFTECDSIRAVTFEQGSYFTTDVNWVVDEIEKVQPTGGTPLADSIAKAGDMLRNSNGRVRKIILGTDGKESCGGKPIQVVQQLRGIQFGSAIPTPALTPVSFSQTEPFMEPVRGLTVDVIGIDVSDDRQLREIAEAGGGNYYAGANTQDLAAALISAAGDVSEADYYKDGENPTLAMVLRVIAWMLFLLMLIVGAIGILMPRPLRLRIPSYWSGKLRSSYFLFAPQIPGLTPAGQEGYVAFGAGSTFTNCSQQCWYCSWPDGSQVVLSPGESIWLKRGVRINFGEIVGEVR